MLGAICNSEKYLQTIRFILYRKYVNLNLLTIVRQSSREGIIFPEIALTKILRNENMARIEFHTNRELNEMEIYPSPVFLGSTDDESVPFLGKTWS